MHAVGAGWGGVPGRVLGNGQHAVGGGRGCLGGGGGRGGAANAGQQVDDTVDVLLRCQVAAGGVLWQ